MTRTDESTANYRRNDQRDGEQFVSLDHAANIAYVSEALRAAQPVGTSAKTEEKLSVFWRVFGGTLLSITALVMIQAYQSLSTAIHEIRADQNRMRDVASDFVKKDDLSNRTTTLWNRVQELQNLNASLMAATTKLATMESHVAATERECKDQLRELQALRERIAKLEGQQLPTPLGGSNKTLFKADYRY